MRRAIMRNAPLALLGLFAILLSQPEARAGIGKIVSVVETTIADLFGAPLSKTVPTDNQVLTYDATAGTWGPEAAAGGASSLAGTLAVGNTSDGTNLQIASGDRLILDGPGTNRSIVNANIGGTAALWVANEAGTAASGIWGNIFEARSDNGVQSYSALNANGLTLYEQPAPSGTANQVKVYAVDDGSGNSEAWVLFGSGASHLLATEAAAGLGFSAFTGVKLRRTVAFSLANGGDNVEFDSTNFVTDWDTHTFHTGGTNGDRLTVPTGQDGKYEVLAGGSFANNTTGYRQLKVRHRNSSDTILEEVCIDLTNAPSTTTGLYLNGSGIVEATAGDYFELFLVQTSGGALDTVASTTIDYTYLSLRRLD